jgi:hypothetical protein
LQLLTQIQSGRKAKATPVRAATSEKDGNDADAIRQSATTAKTAAAAAAATAKKKSANSARPIVFIHGLGHGLIYYLGFLVRIRERPLLLLELPHVSTRMWERVPTPLDTVLGIQTILQEHNFRKAVFIGHS